MTSICNYSQPELQITEGLVRHGGGFLFPYNPEFYELASGLYGPGSLFCWYLLLVSVIINWICYEPEDKDESGRGITNDLLAAFAYPVIAATDLVIRAMQCLTMEYRALAIFCLRNPIVDLTGFATFNDTQLDLRHIPPEIMSLGQHAIGITGPLAVCYTFGGYMCIFLLIYCILGRSGPSPLSKWAERLSCFAFGYNLLMLAIFYLSLGDLAISFFINFYEALQPVLWTLTICECAVVAIVFPACLIELGSACIKSDKDKIFEALKNLGAVLFFSTFPAFMIFASISNKMVLMPDLAISITQTDQLAALLGGIVTLCYTLHYAYLRVKGSKEDDAEEMQALSDDVP